MRPQIEIFSFRITSFHENLILVIEVSKKKQTERKEMIIENRKKKNCVKQHQTTTISYRGRIFSLKNHKPKKH